MDWSWLLTPDFKSLASAIVFSALIVAIQITSKSESGLGGVLTFPAFLYFCVVSVGNSVATFLAKISLADTSMGGWDWLVHAFVGVFGFEAIIQNLNISLRDRGVLTIHDWIVKAESRASAAAITHVANLKFKKEQELAERLRTISAEELNAHLSVIVGKDVPAQLTAEAKNSGSDERLLKALALAQADFPRANTIINKAPQVTAPAAPPAPPAPGGR